MKPGRLRSRPFHPHPSPLPRIKYGAGSEGEGVGWLATLAKLAQEAEVVGVEEPDVVYGRA